MLPLGDFWTGRCLAAPDLPFHPDRTTLRHSCNLGYSRESCGHFPAHETPDAVRFTVRGAAADCIRIDWVVERDHLPVSHGTLDYLPCSGGFLEPPAPPIARQAFAYLASYHRRKSEAVADCRHPINQ